MFDYFFLGPDDPGDPDPIEMTFSFDYEIHLTGDAGLDAAYYSDASVGMSLEYEDAFGDWQPVPGGQLFHSEFIEGAEDESDSLDINGQLSATVALEPDVVHAVQFTVYPNNDNYWIPEPATLVLLLIGAAMGLCRFGRRTCSSSAI